MQVARVTVIGAGNMGSGIAQAFAQAGFTVTLNDKDAEAISRGLARLRGPLEKRVEAGRMRQEQVDAVFANLHPEPDLEKAVADAELVVEAVFEDLGVKKELFGLLDGLCPENTVLATNTSSFRVRDIAAATKRPERVVGLHFFFPAHINKLVEVVRSEASSDAAFKTAYEATRRAGKIAVETADAPGFAVNRFFVPWVNEACRMLGEGVADIPTIETAAKSAFGIPMGPFELMNVTGVPISLHAQRTLHQELGPFYEPADALAEQVGKGTDWDLSGDPDPEGFEEVAARLRGVVFGIACHLADEGVATIRDTDKGATIGLRWRRGPFSMMNETGVREALEEVRTIHARWGEAFPLPAGLVARAKKDAAWEIRAVTLELEGQVATVTFDRPEAQNALDARVLGDLDVCLDAIEKEADVRAVVVTGEGTAFIAGADIPTMRSLDPQGAQAYTDLGERVLSRLAALPCPVIMAINGFALGGGLELALCGDLLYASDKAKLGLPEVGLGIHPGFGGTQRLPRRVGVGPAKELVFTGRTIGAKEAARLGLVEAVVPDADLMGHCMQVAREIASKAPLAVQGAKRSIDQGMGTDLGSGLQVEKESVILLFQTKDKDEGLSAFLERRPPRFQGA